MSDRALLRGMLRTDLVAFVEKVFHTVSSADVFYPNWHIEAVADALLRTHNGESRRLIINQPPRSLKSICTSVAFVAWALGHDPRRRFACVSYSSDLAVTLARQFRLVVKSPWYQELFPGTRLDKETEFECLTTKGGGRMAISIGGTLTGRGADVIIIDDPLKADEAHSEKSRTFVNDWFGTTLISRLNDKGKGVIILVMQRLHEDDLAGKLLGDGGWEHLDLPAIAVADQTIPTGVDVFYERKQGEVLHPAREPRSVLDNIKREMGTLDFSAQYQQRPVPLEGNLVKREWFEWSDVPPQRQVGTQIVQSWDIATTTGATNDWSVCTTWLMAQKIYYLLDVWRGRLEFPQVRRKVGARSLFSTMRTSFLSRTRDPAIISSRICVLTPFLTSLIPSASSRKRTRSCAWKRRAPASRPVKSSYQKMLHGSTTSCMSCSPFQTPVMTIKSIVFRSF